MNLWKRSEARLAERQERLERHIAAIQKTVAANERVLRSLKAAFVEGARHEFDVNGVEITGP